MNSLYYFEKSFKHLSTFTQFDTVKGYEWNKSYSGFFLFSEKFTKTSGNCNFFEFFFEVSLCFDFFLVRSEFLFLLTSLETSEEKVDPTRNIAYWGSANPDNLSALLKDFHKKVTFAKI